MAVSSSSTPAELDACSIAGTGVQLVRSPKTTLRGQANLCRSAGFKPLDLTLGNLHVAVAVLLQCAGARGRAWVNSHQGRAAGTGLVLAASDSSVAGILDDGVREMTLCSA